jgi:O-antigen ligase
MIKFLFLLFFAGLNLFRFRRVRNSKRDGRFLLVSFFLISVPFQLHYPLLEINCHNMIGTLGNKIYFYFPLLLCLFIVFNFNKLVAVRRVFYLKGLFLALMLIITLSLINPLNSCFKGVFVFAIFIFSHALLFKQFVKYIPSEQIVKGLFDGLLVLSIVQFLLALCFPLLGIIEVTSFFHISVTESATRFGNRAGAIGTFVHPGNLSLFLLMACNFFLTTFFLNYKRRYSLVLLLINIFSLYLTYSRTSYLAIVISLFIVFFIYRHSRVSFLSFKFFLRYFVPISISVIWLVYLSPISETFLEDDSSDQLNNRMIHYYMAINAFEKSPLLGVGLNSHVNLFSGDLTLSNVVTNDDFFSSNPIHNIHLIVLIETGVIGFLLWVIFVIYGFVKAKRLFSRGKSQIWNLSYVGVLIGYIFYGITGWAPFSVGILPFFLFFTYFTYVNNRNKGNSDSKLLN